MHHTMKQGRGMFNNECYVDIKSIKKIVQKDAEEKAKRRQRGQSPHHRSDSSDDEHGIKSK
jgi:hypothetical protein